MFVEEIVTRKTEEIVTRKKLLVALWCSYR